MSPSLNEFMVPCNVAKQSVKNSQMSSDILDALLLL